MTPGAGAVRPHCLRCGSARVVPGNAEGKFTPYERKDFSVAFFSNQMPVIWICGDFFKGGDAAICLDCGLLWSSVDLDQANQTIQGWGTKQLKDRIAPETSSGR